MHNRRQNATLTLRNAKWGVWTKLHLTTSVSLSACCVALGLSLTFSTPATAQQSPIIDLADPYVSVDLSVLSDGGLNSRAGTPGILTSGHNQGQVLGQISATGQAASGSQPPGAITPVSELYIKPTLRFKLPEQTKAIESTYAQSSEGPSSEEADHEVADNTPSETPVVAKAPAEKPEPRATPAKTVSAPPAPPSLPEATEIADILPPPEAKEAAPIAAPALSPAKPVVDAKPAAKPAEEVAALTPPPPPKPTPAPAAAVVPAPVAAAPVKDTVSDAAPAEAPNTAQDTAKDTPTPTVETAPNKPLALKTPTPAVESAAAQQDTAKDTEQAIPMPPPAAPHAEASNALIMPLPPKAEAPAAVAGDVASLPSASQTLSDGDSLRIVFDADSSKLPKSARDSLLDMSTKMSGNETLRLQLLAYAGTADTSASAARRLSLSRALAVRSFLIENGVRSTRIDVRALGNKSSDAVSERVDITVIER